MGRLLGTKRIVAAGPQNFMPSQSGRTSVETSPMSKYPIPSKASQTSTTRNSL
jgi:hypothetical protein